MYSSVIFASALAAFAGVVAAGGASGAFTCQSPLGIQPHPACCKTATPTDSDGGVAASSCYIDVRTINQFTGDCSTGPSQYAGYKGVCCFSTFQLTGGTFPTPEIANPSSTDCYDPTLTN